MFSRTRITLSALVSLFLPVLALASTGEVRVPRDIARASLPPAHTRTCTIQFDGRQTVGTPCQPFLYEENWDGPVLLATNNLLRPIWVSYMHVAKDGRVYQGPCYMIPAGSTRAIPDQTIDQYRRRQVNVAVLPGFGFPDSGFQPNCTTRRSIVSNPPEWADEK